MFNNNFSPFFPFSPPNPNNPNAQPYPQNNQNNQNNQAPQGGPPSFTPTKGYNSGNLKAVDSGAIRFCKYRFTYLWLNDGQEFWAWLTYVGHNSISGFRWKRGRWVYFGTDLYNVNSFTCDF